MYYSLQAFYDGVTSNFCLGDSDQALTIAEKTLRAVLKELNIKEKHQYAWPDGSLYKYIESDMGEEELVNHINHMLGTAGDTLKYVEVTLIDGLQNPYKGGPDGPIGTVAEYMALED